jgi:hypothetical protein
MLGRCSGMGGSRKELQNGAESIVMLTKVK